MRATREVYSRSTIRKVRKLHQLFVEGGIPGPEQHEVNPGLPRGSRENYLYFTLPCCLNFQRSSPALWRSALETFNDPDTRYLFFPESVCLESEAKVRSDMHKHRLAIQTNKHPHIWLRICETLNGYYGADPRQVLEEGQFDVEEIVQLLQVRKKHVFPYLGGIKLSNYWLFILTSFTDVKLTNIDSISIIPDTHVIRSTIHLQLAPTNVSAAEVERIWRLILRETGLSPVTMHSALWRWSRNGFQQKV